VLRLISYRHILLFTTLLATCTFIACRKIPKFSETPNISFQYISATPYYNADQPIAGQQPGEPTADSVMIGIHIEDGNGDIGQEPKNRTDENINYFVDLYRKTNGTFQPVVLNGLSYNGHTPLLNPTSTPGPIEADMFYKIIFTYSFGQAQNDTVKFVIKLKDRAGNMSNSVETLPVILRKTP
jgi:hypothetical protein